MTTPNRSFTTQDRLRRIETKLSKLLAHHGLDPVTGDPLPRTTPTPVPPVDYANPTTPPERITSFARLGKLLRKPTTEA